MLPGFRFLFAAIILSTSILMFGLGAAALLRAAHEEVANIPARLPPPERVFAQANEPPPTLAMLRLEPPPAENVPDGANTTTAPEPVAEATAPAEPEKLAAVEPEDSAAAKMPEPAPAQTAKAEAPTEEPTPAPSEAPAPPEATATAEEAKSVSVVETPAPATEAAPAEPEPTATTVAPATSVAATRIATPGDPAATIEESASAKPASAKPDQSAVKKRTRTQRAKAHRHARLGACPNSRCSILSESDSTLGYEQVFSPLEYRSDAASAAECAGLRAERPCLAVYR
jgi:hypothetical protein